MDEMAAVLPVISAELAQTEDWEAVWRWAQGINAGEGWRVAPDPGAPPVHLTDAALEWTFWLATFGWIGKPDEPARDGQGGVA